MNRFVAAARAGLLCMVLVVGAPVLAADATLNQVYEAVHAGRLDQAQGMMTEVLRDHPDSAKAHYVEAEILARQGRHGQAQDELNRAEQLAPGLPFVSPTSVQELRGLIAGASAPRAPIATGVPAIAPAAQQSSFPWGLLLIALVGGFVIYGIVRARRNAAMAPYGAAAGGAPYGGSAGAPSYGVPPAAPAGGVGSGIVGGLVTGAALGAGMVAGEALAHDLMGRHGSGHDLPRDDAPATPVDDLGGQNFGINDAGSWDDGGGSLGVGGGDDWS
jgi:hypothetical protein